MNLNIALCLIFLAITSTFLKAESSAPDLPKTYVIKDGDSLWSIAKRAYHDPAKWPLLYRKDNKPFVNPDKILNGVQIVAPVELRTARLRQAKLIAWAHNEKSWPLVVGRFPGQPPVFQPGANNGVTNSHDGRYYVLDKDGYTIYGYNINYKPLCQMSALMNAQDPYRAGVIAFQSGKNGGDLVLCDNSGHIRILNIPMPPDFSPLPTATPNPNYIAPSFNNNKPNPVTLQINHQLYDEWVEIQKGLRTEKITKAQSKVFDDALKSISQQEAAFLKQNGNFELTSIQQNQLKQLLEANEKSLTADGLSFIPTPTSH